MSKFQVAAMMTCLICIGFNVPEIRCEDAPKAKPAEKSVAPAILDFFLLIGQSNMAGRGKYEKEDGFPKGMAYVLDDKDEFIELQPYPFINHYSTIRKSAAQISPGYTFGLEMIKAFPGKPVGFVSNARGGTSIKEWEKGTKYFDEAVRRTKEAVRQGGKLKAILWHQGETDYREVLKHKGEESKYLEEYFKTLGKFIKDLRSEIGEEKIPFIAGQLNRQFSIFNERILKLPEEIADVYVVKSDGLKTIDDSHFDRESVLELGRRYAEKYLSIEPPR